MLRPCDTAQAVWAISPGYITALRAASKAVSVAPTQAATLGPVTTPAIAYVPVKGVLVSESTWLGAMGLIEEAVYDDIVANVFAAMSAPGIKTVVLDIDSPGGMVDGLGNAMAGLARAQDDNPRVELVAYVRSQATSAAQVLAAAPRGGAVAAPDATLGSIGVYHVFEDTSAAHAEAGIKVHVVKSGAFKGVGEPGTVIDEAALAYFQQGVNASAERVVSLIETARGIDRERVSAIADGRTLSATEALQAGLIDSIADPFVFMDALAAAAS